MLTPVRRLRILLALPACLCLLACGSEVRQDQNHGKDAGRNYRGPEAGPEAGSTPEDGVTEDAAPVDGNSVDGNSNGEAKDTGETADATLTTGRSDGS